MKKKHQPGCPCCETPNPCGCDVSQLRIDLISNDLYQMLCGAMPIGGPCPYIDFTFDISGTYYIPATMEETILTLEFPNTNGVQECDTGRYCAILLINVKTEACFVSYNAILYIFWDATKTKTTCPTLDTIDWVVTSASGYDFLGRNWCGSIDDDDLLWSNGNEECPGTPLEVTVQIYPSA